VRKILCARVAAGLIIVDGSHLFSMNRFAGGGGIQAIIVKIWTGTDMSIPIRLLPRSTTNSTNLPELYRRVREVMDTTKEPWELILVDDGSTDGSTEGSASWRQRTRPSARWSFVPQFLGTRSR